MGVGPMFGFRKKNVQCIDLPENVIFSATHRIDLPKGPVLETNVFAT